MRIIYIICTTIFSVIFTSTFCYAQSNNPTITIGNNPISIGDLIDQIESNSNYFFAFNSEVLSGDTYITLSENSLSLSEIINEWDTYYPYDLKVDNETNKILINRSAKFRITGVVVDSFSGETMQDVLLYQSADNFSYTNEDGYFSFIIDTSLSELVVSHVGYEISYIPTSHLGGSYTTVPLSYKESNFDITILDTPLKKEEFRQENEHSQQDIEESISISGIPDLISYLKTIPSVSSGSEGQSGFNIRGGGTDQNLILLDGFPLYEASHLGGLSSVFLTDAIKNVEFYDSGMPSRYGGRLSSVVNVRLKEGNRNKIKKKVSIGVEGVQGQIEGPLSSSTSINITGKKSLFSEIARPLLKDRLDLLEADLSYHDLYGKITHWFSPSNRISITGYTGSDRIGLQRNLNETEASFQDLNRINWGNNILGIQWNTAFKDKFFFTTSLGYSEYRFRSLGSYLINFERDGIPENESYTIITESQLQDVVFSSSLDYYHDDAGKFRFGFDYTDHTNSPSIVEDANFIDVNSPEISVIDSLYKTRELATYIEHDIALNENLTLYSGIRYNIYETENTFYHHVNPRLKLQYSSKYYSITGSYSRLSQFVHLLSNPGPGLPSDLWVPSTDNLSPERSSIFDLRYRYNKDNFDFGVSTYYKNFNSVIEYDNPSDIIYSFIINTELYQVEVNNVNWEERVDIGRGEAYGIEFNGAYRNYSWELSGSYTLSRSTRSFPDIDNGNSFPYKFDRTHDLSLVAKYNITSNQSIRFNFVYGTGNAFTLRDTRALNPDGQVILIPTERNGYRVPDFHHLDIIYSITHSKDNKTFKANIGVYNVYNRLNPFYLYLQQSNNNDVPLIKKISIYPILPQLNFSYSW
jgi:outer membrane receptor for ferrienterochelin and colicin